MYNTKCRNIWNFCNFNIFKFMTHRKCFMTWLRFFDHFSVKNYEVKIPGQFLNNIFSKTAYHMTANMTAKQPIFYFTDFWDDRSNRNNFWIEKIFGFWDSKVSILAKWNMTGVAKWHFRAFQNTKLMRNALNSPL